MITEAEYLKAKAIVDQYERDEYERNQRQADCDLEEDDPMMQECEFCCRPFDDHALNCPNNDSPFAQLIREGYD